jgi:hypothetical protein
MDDPTRRWENDTGIRDAPSGALPNPKRGAHFFAIPFFRTYFFNQIIPLTRSDAASFFAIAEFFSCELIAFSLPGQSCFFHREWIRGSG